MKEEMKKVDFPLEKKLLGEFVGTFVFISVIFFISEPIPIAVGLLAAIYLFGGISGGHYNPAVTLSFLADKKIETNPAIMYIIA